MKVSKKNLGVGSVVIDQRAKKYINQILQSERISYGPFLKRFEEEFSRAHQVKFGITVNSGTSALCLAVACLKETERWREGDEILVPAVTFIATSNVLIEQGLKPVFVDVDPRTYNIDPSKIEAKITKRTKAIIPVHLYGLPAEMDEIMQVAKKHNLMVIEDCAQAHGATYRGKKVGTIGHAGSFSFYPGKNLGAYGDAGCIVTKNKIIAEQCRMIGNHGQLTKYEHKRLGRNSRLDGLQAAILSAKLKHLDRWNALRRKHAELYTSLLKTIPEIATPACPSYSSHVYHVYAIQTKKRDSLKAYLKEKGIKFEDINVAELIREELEKTVQRQKRKVNASGAVVLTDIDFFKKINDQYGHIQGDSVLQEVGGIFETVIRKHLDVAGRYGGEEFLLIYEDTTTDQVLNIVERLRQTIEDHEFIKIGPAGIPLTGECLHVTMSFGIALFNDRALENSKEILALADAALYRSKEGGRNRATLGGR